MSRVTRKRPVDVAVRHRASLAKGSAWLAGCSELIWMDIDHGRLHRYSPGNGGARLDRAWLRPAGGRAGRADPTFELEDPRTRMNDGACDRAGRCRAGTMCGISGRRPFVEVPSALWGGAAVHRFTPAGRLDARLELPVSQVTSCCFGGDDLDTLFVTTAARGVAASEALAGALFACRPGVTGPPALPFAS